MTDPDVAAGQRLAKLGRLVVDGVVTMGEAITRVRKDRGLLSGGSVTEVAEGGWTAAKTHRHIGCLVAWLLHEWVLRHAADDPLAAYASGRAFVKAATEVLMVRHDGYLYRHARQAADQVLAAAPPEVLPHAHHLAGMLHLAPYALDPAEQDYLFVQWQRRQREQWDQPTHVIAEHHRMPEPAIGLGHATRHLKAAVAGLTGEAKGAVLVHLAFAEYSRLHVTTVGDLAVVDRWCDEAAELITSDSDTLACNRLPWLYILRRRLDSALGLPIVIPPMDAVPNGSMYTLLIGTTLVRVLGKFGKCDVAQQIVDTIWPLVADDPDLEQQRMFLGSVAAHALPGDPIGCAARQHSAGAIQELRGAALAAGRVHGLLHGPDTEDSGAEEAAVDSVRSYAPHLFPALERAVAHRRWMTARLAPERPVSESVPLLINSVILLARNNYPQLAMTVLQLLKSVLEVKSAELPGIDMAKVAPALLPLSDTVFTRLSEGSCREVVRCLWILVGSRVEGAINPAGLATLLANLFKGRALAAAVARPGRAPRHAGTDPALAEPAAAASHWIFDTESMLTSPLHSAEREPGSTAAQRRANMRRKAQAEDISLLMAAVEKAPLRSHRDIQRALPEDAVLLNVCVDGQVGLFPAHGFYAVMAVRDRTAVYGVRHPERTTRRYAQLLPENDQPGVQTTEHTDLSFAVASLRRELVEDPLHRNVTREGERQLAECTPERIMPRLAEFAAAGHTRLIFWPNESAYLLPMHLLPFEDGILADRFTVTILPSVECLFPSRKTAGANPGVHAIACAAGGLPLGLPEEPSLHEQAERIAARFGTRPLTGDEATPSAALQVLGTSRYLHLAAHGAQDVDAPLFARMYLAGGALHAYEILEQDLRCTELVTLSACESALLRYDFLDNLHGLAPAFLRAGANAVIGALWQVGPEVAATFFTELYTRLAGGSPRVDAFRKAQLYTRDRHPNYRDWGAFTYLGG